MRAALRLFGNAALVAAATAFGLALAWTISVALQVAR